MTTNEHQQRLREQLTPLTPLDGLVPPMLEEAIGYSPAFMGRLPMMRYVAFYWERCGDEVMFDDGATSATGNWHQFLLYVQHRLIGPHLRAYDFGSSEDEPAHYLILDREERRLFVAPVDLAGTFLLAQHIRVGEPSVKVFVDSMEDLTSLIGMTTGWQEIIVDQERVAAAMQRDEQLYTAMSAWLEQHG